MRHKTGSIAMALVLVTLAVYWQVSAHDFISLDDYAYVTQNRHVNTGLTKANAWWAFTSFHEGNWHPLTWLSHMADCSLFGLTARYHHLMNVLFHLFNTLILFMLMKRLTGATWRSGLLAALFALHPLHVESVAWLAERKDLLATCFWLLALLAYACFTEKRSLSSYLFCLGLFALGLMSKPMIVTFPFMLLLLDYWPLGRYQLTNPRNTQRLVLEKIPFFILSAISCVVTYYAQASGDALAHQTPFAVRAANALLAYAGYLHKLLWPAHLAAFYPFPDAVPVAPAAGAALLLLSVTAAAFLVVRRHPYLPMGWFWFLGTLVPVIGLVRVGSQGMADRYTYFPSIGLFIMIVWGGEQLTRGRKFGRPIAAVIAGVALMAMTAATYVQIGYWKDVVTLFEHSLKVTGVNFYGNNILWTAKADAGKEGHFARGLKAAREERFEQAASEFAQVLAIDANDVQARYNLGLACQKQNKIAEAMDQFQSIVARHPDHPGALQKLSECREAFATGKALPPGKR